MLLQTKHNYIFITLTVVIATLVCGNPKLTNAERGNDEVAVVDDYYSYEDETYKELIPKITFCCDRHHYYNMKNRSCSPSVLNLEPIFHKPNGTRIYDEVNFKNFTEFNNCSSYIVNHPEFVLLNTGEALLKSTKAHVLPQYVPNHRFCLIWAGKNSSHHNPMAALVCFPEKNKRDALFSEIANSYILPIAMSISALFLGATFVAYCLVKELQDMLGKCLMCSVAALCLSKVFGVLGRVAFSGSMRACVTMGVCMYGGFLVSFFWLNVLSIIIFITIWYQGRAGQFSSKRWFIFSCLYGYGIPMLIMTLLLIHDFTQHFDNALIPKPGLGRGSCGFSDRGAMIVYFYAPISILLGVNLLLFCLSACRLFFLSKNTSANTFQFKHYLKLFILMGIPWIFEVLSFFFSNARVFSASTLIWFSFDLFNALQGVIIFIVFICRKAVLVRLAEVIRGRNFAMRKYPEYFMQHTCDDGNLNLSQDLKLNEAEKKNTAAAE